MFTQSVRSDAIWERSSLVVEQAARYTRRFQRQMERRLRAARINGMTVTCEPVRIGERFTSEARTLLVRSDRFRDLRVLVVARPAGVHLEVLFVTALQPGWLKRTVAGLVSRGAWWAWSLPGGISRQEELRTLLTVIETAVQSVARRLAARAAGPDGLLPPEHGSVLEEWN